MIWKLVALVTYAAAYAACFAATRTVRRRPAGLDAALAAAVFVCGEALVVHGLSPFHAVGRGGLLAGNAVLIASASAVAWSRRARLARLPRPRLRLHPATGAVLLLGAMVLVSAVAYTPNTYDSMTYHLARVAHWLQHGSVAAYATSIRRQIVYPPGAEYLVLGLQGISGSDRLASLVQFGSWVLLAGAAAPLARLFGAPRRLAPFAALLAAAGPLAVQEASSTQNDLVAGVLAVAMVSSALPFVHRRASWRAGDLALTILAVTAGIITKPSSVVVAAPFLAWGLARSLGTLRRKDAWRRIAIALPALAVTAGVIGPFERARAATPPDPALFEPFLYLHAGDVEDRALNALRGLVRNIPLPIPALNWLSPEQTVGCDRPRDLCLCSNLLFLEDSTGSIGQAAVVLAALVAGLTRGWRLPRRTRIALTCLAGAWLLFHAVFRDNVWVQRLHLAFFALAPLALGAFRGRWADQRAGRATFGLVAAGLVAHAGVAAVKTEQRPFQPNVLRSAGADPSYYRWGPPGVASQHEAVLKSLAGSGCKRLGLHIGKNSYDYPLTWRAMKQGIEVRHLVDRSEWPCAVFSDQGVPPGDEQAWKRTDLAFLYVPASSFSKLPLPSTLR